VQSADPMPVEQSSWEPCLTKWMEDVKKIGADLAWVSFQKVILLLRKPSWPLFQNKSCLNLIRQRISIEIKLPELK